MESGARLPTGALTLHDRIARDEALQLPFFREGCEAALAFYTECGFGSVSLLVRYGAGPMQGKVMHSLFSGPGVNFFASDNDDAEPMRGSAMMFELIGAQWMFNCTGPG